MTTSLRLMLAGFVAFGTHRGIAQIPAAVGQVDSVKQRRAADDSVRSSVQAGDSAAELFPGESSDVGPQSVLSIKPRRTLFQAVADIQYFYTDNMFLTEHNQQEAGVLVSTAQFALAPTAYPLGAGQFSPRIGFQEQWYDFGLGGAKLQSSTRPLGSFDFSAQTAFADGQWSYGNWILEAGFDYMRLVSTPGYDQFYEEYVPRWAARRFFPVNEKLVFSLAYEGDYRFSNADTLFDSDFNNRTDQNLVAACTWMLCRQVVLQPYYRFKYTLFTAGPDRQDYLNSLGVGLYWFLTPRINLRAYISYDLKNSTGNEAFNDYNKLDAGGGLNFTFQF